MLALGLCLPQKWERAVVITPPEPSRPRVRQRPPTPTPAAEILVNGEGGKSDTPGQRPSSPTVGLGEPMFAPSRGLAPELTAALKEAVEEAAAYAEAGNDIDIGIDDNTVVDSMDVVELAPTADGSGGVDPGDPAVAPVSAGEDQTTVGSNPAETSGGPSAEAAAVSPMDPPAPDQPFVRKAQGTWLTVDSSDDDDFDEDDELGMAGTETEAGAGAGAEVIAEANAEAEEGAKTTLPNPPVHITSNATESADGPTASAPLMADASADNGREDEPPAAVTIVKQATIATDVSVVSVAAIPPAAASPLPTAKMGPEPLKLPAPLPPSPSPPIATEVQSAQELPQSMTVEVETPSHTIQSAIPPPTTKTVGPTIQVFSMPLDLEDWRERVRRAETAADLASLALEIDRVLPREESWLQPWYKTASFMEPHVGGGSSLAAAATRVFALDRALRWDVIPRPRRGGTGLPGDLPRTWPFFHQCPMSPLCIRPGLHKGKCRHHRSGISRVDHPMLVPAPKYVPPYRNTYASPYTPSYSFTPPPAPAPAPATASATPSYAHWVHSKSPSTVTGWAPAVAPTGGSPVTAPVQQSQAASAVVSRSTQSQQKSHVNTTPASCRFYAPVGVPSVAAATAAPVVPEPASVARPLAAAPGAVTPPPGYHFVMPSSAGTPSSGTATSSGVFGVPTQPSVVAPAPSPAAAAVPPGVPQHHQMVGLGGVSSMPSLGAGGMWLPGVPRHAAAQLRVLHAEAAAEASRARGVAEAGGAQGASGVPPPVTAGFSAPTAAAATVATIAAATAAGAAAAAAAAAWAASIAPPSTVGVHATTVEVAAVPATSTTTPPPAPAPTSIHEQAQEPSQSTASHTPSVIGVSVVPPVQCSGEAPSTTPHNPQQAHGLSELTVQGVAAATLVTPHHQQAQGASSPTAPYPAAGVSAVVPVRDGAAVYPALPHQQQQAQGPSELPASHPLPSTGDFTAVSSPAQGLPVAHSAINGEARGVGLLPVDPTTLHPESQR